MYADDLQIYIRCPLEDLDSMSKKMSANAGRIMSSVARSYVDIGGVKVVYESSL